MNRSTVVVVAVIAMSFAFSAGAEKGDPSVLISAMADGSSPSIINNRSTPDSQLVLDISNTASWDALDDSSNVTVVVPLGAGAIMTGIGWDVNITTVGGSWLSEARMYFDGQDLDGSGLFLTPGTDGAPGSGSYSGGPIDLTDNTIPDIVIGADGNLYIQFFESYDDVADAIDANFTANSSLTIDYIAGVQPPTPTPTVDPNVANPIPTMNRYGIIAMVILMLGIAVLVIARRR